MWDDETTALSKAIPMSKQPELFREYLQKIAGEQEAPRIVRQAVEIIHAGTVDFTTNFYILRSNRMIQYTVSALLGFLAKQSAKVSKFGTTLTYYKCNALNFSKIPAILVFGDSAVDTGNNNYIPTIFKANFPPYGMNYPGHIATGRHSDGKLIPDLLVSMQGAKNAVPPFLQPNLSDDELRTGVCFASAGA
ncbi:hypothetical protein ACH5RR_020592 [Cinchona calisaya]|uniref:GDSL esterase/lipase n=1 Tax=Cinchona calisaya TaxID=153742 RepID=A0ABD2ZG45_9GENT